MVAVPSRLWRHALILFLAYLPLLASAQQTQAQEQAFIELSASADEVYVQQQLRLTVKLYYTNQVIQGQLSDPEHPDAVIEKLGEQKQYREQVNGERYRVVERDYVIFPQKPGRLQLSPLEFQGTARHPRGHHYRISDSAVLFPVEVRDIPASFSGNTWLPATDLSLQEKGLENPGPVAPGDNLTRTLSVTAQGLPTTTLPGLDIPYPEAIRSYPEPEQRQSSASDQGVVGVLQQTVALVPVAGKGGEITLPEVRIPWWDVTEDREKVAVLPARTLKLEATPGATPVTPPPATERTPVDPPALEPQPGNVAGMPPWVWPLLAALLALGWVTTALAWWLHGRHRRADASLDEHVGGENARFAQLCERAKALEPAFFNDFPSWATDLTGRPCKTTDSALERLASDHLTSLVDQWREALFRQAGGQPPEGSVLLKALKEARASWLRQHSGAGKRQRDGLPALYPDAIKP